MAVHQLNRSLQTLLSRTAFVIFPLIAALSSMSLHLFLPSAHAELLPTQVVILVNKNDPHSQNVAHYYAQHRGIPPVNIIKLDLPVRETISWREYEERLAKPLKKRLHDTRLSKTTRVLVTTYGVPLRMTASKQTEQEQTLRRDAEEWKTAAHDFLLEIHRELLDLRKRLKANTASPPLSFSQTRAKPRKKPRPILKHIDQTIQSIMDLIRDASASSSSSPLPPNFSTLLIQLEGLSAFSKHWSQTAIPTSLSFPQLQSYLNLAQKIVSLLTLQPTNQNRDLAYQLVQRYFGIRGVYHFASAEIDRFSHKEADASVDSELSLLWLGSEEYSTHWRVPNPFYAWHPQELKSQKDDMPIPLLMVSRIDAPTPQIAKHMIDQALLAEQMGLTGKVYLDARGLKPNKTLGYGDYDESLRNLGRFIEQHTTYPVILENTGKRFSQPGEAPNVAIYAGWYRLRHYEDAFTFNPGAIGYHMASGEAISIHKRRERGWCKNALERGITVTIGPTSEPYLDAFPKPSEFFGLLLTGRYSLVEAYYLAIRHVSWRMTLFGDPLYNPWKGTSLAKFSSLAQEIPEFRNLTTYPIPPSSQSFPDPLASAKTRQKQRDWALSQIPILLNIKFPDH